MTIWQTRRQFLTGLSLAGTAGLLHLQPALAAEGALETTTVRLVNDGSNCIAPEYAADDLLRAEGFTDIRYLRVPQNAFAETMARGEVDFSTDYAAKHISTIDAGVPIVVLAGVHVGCFELFAREGIRNVADLRGKKVGLKEAPAALLTLMAAQVGLDPAKDIRWVTDPSLNPLDLFAEGKIDAFLGFPPEPQELRDRHAGHVIVNTATDRPWSQYFCRMVAGNREYIRRHPVATKRVLRAILKATDLCVTEPARVARRIVDRGFTPQYDHARATLSEVPYDNWRDYDPGDTIRYYALRLYEAGLIKSSPTRIIADGADWRFFNELKRELKA
jgi:NitT/TauT family transport system substrate-binding protein